MRIDVIYLARGVDWGIEAVRRFITSYKKHPSGYSHNLVIAAKAWETKPEEYEELKRLSEEVNAKLIDLPDTGQDFGAYYRAAKILKSDYIFCLSSSSEILTDNWLKIFAEKIPSSGMILAGPAGSWERCPIGIYLLTKGIAERHRRKNLLYNIDKCICLLFNFKYLLKYKIFLQKFPNYHIRTNAFLVNRDLYINYISEKGMPDNKIEAYELESGRDSLTRYCVKSGCTIGVVGQDGKLYPKEEWDKSRTFRVPDMSNLVISDKQLLIYKNGDKELKHKLENYAWGKIFI